MKLSSQALMQQASKATGLTNFGDDIFRVGLDKLVDAINQESQANEMGEMVFPGSIVGHLVNRLQIEDWYTRHPEIDNEIIQDPVFITGLPRTGSTVLGHMLALDPNTRCLRGWEAKAPCPPPDISLQNDPRIAENQAREDQMNALAPGIGEALPRNPNAPEECFTLLDLSFADIAANAFYHVPSFERWVIQENLAEVDAAYQYHRRVLKLLQWKTPAKRWVLRSPVHSLSLTSLLKSYPDARFIMTHRWPHKVIPSISSLVFQVKELFLNNPHPELLGPSMLEQWNEAIQRLLHVRETLDENRFFDLYHSEQIVDPEPGLRALYQWLGWDFSEDFLAQVNAWRVENPKGSHKSDPAFFGLDLNEVQQRFAFYTQKFSQRL